MQNFEAEKAKDLSKEPYAETLLFPPDIEKIRATFRAIGRSADSEQWKIKIENSVGQRFIFQFTLAGIALGSATLMFLSRAGNGTKWGILAATCTFILGMRLQKPSAQESPVQAAEPEARTIKDFTQSKSVAPLGTQSMRASAPKRAA